MKYLDLIDDAVGLGDIGDLQSLVDRFLQMSPENILELALAVRDNLPRPSLKRSPFRFVGNTEMSALPYPCSGLNCRSDGLGNASLFAAMYADEVTLFNPFSYEDFFLNGYEDLIVEVSFYISNLIALHPLIERGIVTFADFTSYRLCQSCFNKGVAAMLNDEVDSTIYFRFFKLFLNETTTIYDGKNDGEHHFKIKTDGDFTGHSQYVGSLQKMPRGLGRLKVGQILDESQSIKLGFIENPARYLTNDLVDTNVIANDFKIRNVSTTESQISVMKDIFGEQEILNSVDIKYPFIAQRDLREVLKFRDQEWHHLHDFRKALDDGLGSGEDVASVFRDEEAKIEKVLRGKYRALNRDLIDGAGKVAFHATATAATGGMSAVISTIVAALGGKHLVDSVIPLLRKKFEEPEEPRESRFYYAWRLKRDLIGKDINLAA